MNNSMETFTDEDQTIILEIARIALSDSETFDFIVEKLDLNDWKVKDLQGKIEGVTNG